MNKVLYAREGARSIMDRTFEDFPWQVRVEVDGVEIEVPEVSQKKYQAEVIWYLDDYFLIFIIDSYEEFEIWVLHFFTSFCRMQKAYLLQISEAIWAV